MSDEIYQGKINFRNIIFSFIIAFFSFVFYSISKFVFIGIIFIAIIFLLTALPRKIIIKKNGIFYKNFLTNEKLIANWNEIIEFKHEEVNSWDSAFKIFSNLLIFGWISILIFGSKYKQSIVIYSEYQEFKIKEYSYQKYDELVQKIEGIINKI